MKFKEYNVSSPFPPTEEQVHYCGQILSNSVAALFAMQAPPAEIAYAAVVAEELKLYSKPIIEFAMHKFREECCFTAIEDVNLAKASANKALSTLDKILVMNNHYQLMSDFNVWDVYNPPSLKKLKQLASRHPFQPISALLRKEVNGYKNDIHLQLKTIIAHLRSNSGCEERLQSENCGMTEIPPSRYCYPHQKDYWRLENNLIFNVMGGKVCEQLNSKEFKISMNELFAFYINSDAKFRKVYTEGASKCFLMPAEFKDEAMRKYFRVKFEQFRESGSALCTKEVEVNFVGVQEESNPQEMDFAEEHSERRSVQQQYIRDSSSAKKQEAGAESGQWSDLDVQKGDGESSLMKDENLRESGILMDSSSHIFDSEVQRAQKYFVDAREACLLEWELRDRIVSDVEVLCTSIKAIISGNHGDCDCMQHKPPCTTYEQHIDRYLKLLRDANRDLENLQPVSQCLESILRSLQNIYESSKDFKSGLGRKVDKQDMVSSIDDLLQFYTLIGTHSTCLFYEKNEVYEDLKARSYGICCACGIRTPLPEDSGELKDAVAFKELHEVDEDEVVAYEALREGEEDELGTLAQEAFHIEYVESDERYYHLLNIENPKKENLLENSCCLIKDGKLTKLPVCDDCYGRMKKASKYLKEELEISDEASSKKLYMEADPGQPTAREKAIGMLKRLSFKRCDLVRIPRSLGRLSNCGRTAIAPFIAYTIIRQLHSSKHLPQSSQHSTKGSKFSIPSEEIGGKEFVIPLSHEEFVNSFKTKLPREDVAIRHRVLFLGNEKKWNSLESVLNRQNRGQSFDIVQCYNFLRLLKKTGALSREYSVKRKKSLGLLQRKIVSEMSQVSRTTDSSMGVVLETSPRVQQMNNACSDDVAAARLRVQSTGMKVPDPGITSSLFWNKSSQSGNLPLLKSMLSSLSGKRRICKDSLLLKIKRELPNEFENFSDITTHTFPDLFPIPLKDKTINFTNVNIRRHLLDYYDNRFSDKIFIFWLFGILTRHKSIYETCAFFKKNTKAREQYEKMCNDPELEEKLERAVENENSREAKKLNKKFTSLLRIVGGNTPWSTLERQATLGRVKALCGFFGAPSIFLTIAPCLADSPINIRLCNNVHCSYTMRESTHQERSRWTAADPLACAKAFRLIINTVVHTFIGIPTGNLRRSTFTDILCTDNNRVDSSDTVLAEGFERHLHARRGIMGVAQSIDGIFEPQGRGALHMHAVIFMLVSAELIARCTKRQLQFLCRAIDRVIATWIHEDDVKAEELEKHSPELNERTALRKVPKNMNLLRLGSFSKRIMYRCQYHGKCSYTCFKKKGFNEHCRLGHPKEEFPKTIVHNLHMNRATSGEVLIPTRDPEIGPPPAIGDLGFPGPDSRVHWIDHRRNNAVDCNLVDGNVSLSAALG